MNILYGVCGAGLGHAMHAIAISSYLEKKGHNVKIITYGNAYTILRDKFDTTLINGLTIICDKNSCINYSKTFSLSLKFLIKDLININNLKKIINEFKPDMCITDFEPIVPLISYRYKLPLISISNQNRFINYKINIPKGFKRDYYIAKLVIQSMVPRADYHITLSLSDLKPKHFSNNFYLVSPIIRNEIIKLNLKIKIKNKIVVYLFDNNAEIIKILKEFKNEKFVVFPYEQEKNDGNIFYRKRNKFLDELKDCKAIISNSGFTSVGEAIYLKKPYLAVPLKGQFEQVYNAIYLEENGYGKFVEFPTKENITDFLKQIKKFQKNLDDQNKPLDPNKVYRVLDDILKDVSLKKSK